MRRSTTKAEQASSLPQQEEGIEQIVKTLWIEYESIIPFVESRSGYENRSRKEWGKMLEAIDKCKEPCSILCRDTSRLSRNPTDNLAIANRLFGDNQTKKSIGSIYFLWENFSVQEWTDRSNKKYIVDTLHQNYTDSMETKEKSMAGILLKLSGWEFPYTPPKWLSRVNNQGIKRASKHEKTTLMQNEDMSFIKRAFQMKVEWKTAKEISKYLKQYGHISIAENKIVETIISNTVYKWEYEEQTTKRYFDSIKFFDGILPISRDLWDRANATIGKRGNGYWDKQADHIARGKIKYEDGNPLYLYTTTKPSWKKYRAYGTEIKTNGWERKTVNMMESKIIKEFLNEAMPKIKYIFYLLAWNKELGDDFGKIEDLSIEQKTKIRNTINRNYNEMFQETGSERYNVHFKTFEEYRSYRNEINKQRIDDSFLLGMSEVDIDEFEADINELCKDDVIEVECNSDENYPCLPLKEELLLIYKKTIVGREKLKEALSQATVFDREKEEQGMRDQQKKELEQKKQILEEEKKSINKKAFKLGYSAEVANEMREDTEKEIYNIQTQIDSLAESTDMEQYLERLPEILKKLHELTSNVLCEADIDDMRDDVKKLIDIVAHELVLNNKKELKVELYGTLNNLFFCLE